MSFIPSHTQIISKLKPTTNRKLRIGILGGSFNPAHEGHLHISKIAIKKLKLNFLIWLITPQNPLKTKMHKDNMSYRISEAKKIVKNYYKIKISIIESYFQNEYTYNTLTRIQKIYPNADLFWIMGSDNLMQIHKWYMWQNIFKNFTVIIFERNSIQNQIIYSKAANIFNNYKIFQNDLKEFKIENMKNYDWLLFKIRTHNASSTQIRNSIVELTHL